MIETLSENKELHCCFKDGDNTNFYNDFMSADHQVASRMIIYTTEDQQTAKDMIHIEDYVSKEIAYKERENELSSIKREVTGFTEM